MFDSTKQQPTELCTLAMKYGSDKCPQIGHQYTPFYYELLKPHQNTFKKILEFGVCNRRIFTAIPNYQMGASLRMWRDFFPNAQVYGADIAAGSIFKDERLETFRCDEDKEDEIKALIEKIGGDIDFMVDDCSHHIHQQMFLFKTLMPLLKKDVIYVCEDCGRTRQMMKTYPEYNSYSPKLLPNSRPLAHDGIVVFTNK